MGLLALLVEPLLIVRRALREQIVLLHRRLLAIVREDEVCRRLMTTPGVGPVVALTYRATVDVPARFRKSKSVGAVFGLTCSKYQSGEIDWSGRISCCGDEMMRVMLYEAAQSMLHSTKMVLAQGLGHADRQAPAHDRARWRPPYSRSTACADGNNLPNGRRRKAVMIEINRRLYMDEQTASERRASIR